MRFALLGCYFGTSSGGFEDNFKPNLNAILG